MLAETLRRIYASGYDEGLVIQDFIPGEDDNMRVLNGYVRSDGAVSLLSLGRPVLEDCAPMRIGNYAAIVGDFGYGAMANFPNGAEIQIKKDDLSLAEQDLVKLVGRQYVALDVVAPLAFTAAYLGE